MSDKKTSEKKKAAVLGNPAPGKSRLVVFAGACAVVLAVVGGYYFVSGRGAELPTGAGVAEAAGGEIVLPLAQFSDGQAKFYKLDAQGVTVRYLAVKGSDGAIHTAYDACDSCWHAGKGYQQAGEVMVCRNCSLKFAINDIGKIHGGCNPAPLKSEVRGDRVVIRVTDVQAGRNYFNLPKAG